MPIELKSDFPIEIVQQAGDDLAIAQAAWVKPKAEGDYEKLIPYLMKHRHGSPFEHGLLTLKVAAPIFVWREWHRHRIGFSYNEESARYSVLEPVFYAPPPHRPSMKVENWIPGRPKFTDMDLDTYNQVCHNLKTSYELAYKNYQSNLTLGIDPGLARDCLPVGIYSTCWVTCNPRSIMSLLSLRVHDPKAAFVSYPLWEFDQIARKVEEILNQYWPITHKAFVENKRVAP